MLCKYRHIFGKEREGVHALRLFDVAILDVLGTLFFAWVLSRVTGVTFVWCATGLFVLAVIAHRAFCVHSKINVMIFGHM